MDSDWRARVKDLFLAARGLGAEERSRYLDEACGEDAELRRELESLLIGHDRGGGNGDAEAPHASATESSNDPLIGGTLGRYKILGLVGKGGMGTVYEAEDPELRRRVALKVLPAAVASDPKRLERFKREARSVAALSHPNIVTLYSVEEDGDTYFLTMELVQGEPMDRLIPEQGLDFGEILSRATQLADGLRAAHEAGIVHRDLKPANVIVDIEGRLRILDFGLAKAQPAQPGGSQADTSAALTAHGTVLGTAPYMSPEQVAGRACDHRSDIFSLGTILYEMSTGRRPFSGEGFSQVMSAILQDEPTPITQVRADVPEGLGRVIGRCLEKEPAKRYQTARELREALEELRGATEAGPKDGLKWAAVAAVIVVLAIAGWWLASRLPDSETVGVTQIQSPGRGAPGGTAGNRAAAASRRPVIAVLPFRSATADARIEEFAGNLAGDVIDGVTNSSQAVVLPGSATQHFAGQSADARQVGEELGAGYVLQGTVRLSGDRLRVTAQLVSVEAGTQIWSRRYDRDLADVGLLAASDEIGARIVSAVSDVHGVIFEFERQRVEGRPIAELGPWECIFVTLGYDKFIDAEHHLLAREALEHAIELDSGFALAWGYLSWVTTDEAVYGFNPRPESIKRAMAAARRAVELDPYSHMLRWLLARVFFFGGDIEGFLSEGDKALELNSNDATVIGLIGYYSALSGHWQRGEELMRGAMALNPSYPSYYHGPLALDQFRQGNYEEALTEYRRLTFTGNPLYQGVLTAILGQLGRTEEAAAALGELLSLLAEPTPGAIRTMYERWNVRGELLESLMEGLVKAGL